MSKQLKECEVLMKKGEQTTEVHKNSVEDMQKAGWQVVTDKPEKK